jgi:hypothetical protein
VANREQQRREEREVFRQFCAEVSRDPAAFLHDDRPDFIAPDGSHGVELVEYHYDAERHGLTGSSIRRRESDLEGLLRDAKKRQQGTNRRRNVFVFPRGDPSVPSEITRTDRKEFCDQLLQVVAAQAGDADVDADSLGPVLSRHIDRIWAHDTPEYETEPLWQVVEAAVMDVDLTAVRAVIETKERLVMSYREKVRSVWLLIHSSARPCVGLPERGRPSTCGWITDELRAASFETSFDRVYYFDGDKQETVRLTVR